MQLVIDFYQSLRQEAAGALWNLSFDDRNREAIALAGGVEALVYLYDRRLHSFFIYEYCFFFLCFPLLNNFSRVLVLFFLIPQEIIYNDSQG